MNEVLALMDSAIVKLSKPYFGEAAPYFYERAELRAQAGKFREAVMDYNTFFEALPFGTGTRCNGRAVPSSSAGVSR